MHTGSYVSEYIQFGFTVLFSLQFLCGLLTPMQFIIDVISRPDELFGMILDYSVYIPPLVRPKSKGQ